MNDDDDKVKKLLADAHDAGELSAQSLATLDVVDVGAQIQAGLGVSIDDVAASGVVLLTLIAMPRWPLLWLGQLQHYEHFIPLLVLPGPLLLLALWRYRDKDNYYVVRANALEGNVRLYIVKDGKWVPR